MFVSVALLTAALVAFANAAPASNATIVERAASCTFPSPPRTSSLSSAMTITGTFDGGNVRFDRGSGACKGQTEGGDSDAVFLLQNGATLQ